MSGLVIVVLDGSFRGADRLLSWHTGRRVGFVCRVIRRPAGNLKVWRDKEKNNFELKGIYPLRRDTQAPHNQLQTNQDSDHHKTSPLRFLVANIRRHLLNRSFEDREFPAQNGLLSAWSRHPSYTTGITAVFSGSHTHARLLLQGTPRK